MKKTSRQSGFISMAILFVMLFFGVAYVALVWRGEILRLEAFVSQGAGLMQVRNALQKYAKANKSSFASGKTVMYVNDQYAPTIAELTDLGYFVATGTEINPYGSSFRTQLTPQGNGSITGMVYLNGSVKNAAGAVDSRRACGIAKALGDVGLCTNPVNSAMLGNRTTQIANPTGLPAVIGALIYVSP